MERRIMQGRKINIYHVCTKGLAKGLWFYDELDFVSGMNAVPVCAVLTGVEVWCFCLMDNHVHFILKGTEEECIRFIREYKRLRSRQMGLRYGGELSIVGADISVSVIADADYLRKAIAYVLRNPMEAGITVLPNEYRWSSAGIYFSGWRSQMGTYRRLGDLTDMSKRALFKTRIHLPDDYLLGNDGVIFPGSYVNVGAVEEVYNSPRRLIYFLSSTNDMEMELDSGILKKARYSDSELKASLEGVCAEKFRGREYSSLKVEDRYMAARELRKRYGVGPKQIARVTGLDYERLKSML